MLLKGRLKAISCWSEKLVAQGFSPGPVSNPGGLRTIKKIKSKQFSDGAYLTQADLSKMADDNDLPLEIEGEHQRQLERYL